MRHSGLLLYFFVQSVGIQPSALCVVLCVKQQLPAAKCGDLCMIGSCMQRLSSADSALPSTGDSAVVHHVHCLIFDKCWQC